MQSSNSVKLKKKTPIEMNDDSYQTINICIERGEMSTGEIVWRGKCSGGICYGENVRGEKLSRGEYNRDLRLVPCAVVCEICAFLFVFLFNVDFISGGSSWFGKKSSQRVPRSCEGTSYQCHRDSSSLLFNVMSQSHTVGQRARVI